MQKLLSFITLLCLSASLFAQSAAKKYVFIEHFTNSKCSVCASKNPAFYNLINSATYEGDIHHVSVHPSFPYSSCVFYQYNTVENSAWVTYYDIFGTPSIALNGELNSGGSSLLTAAKLNTYLDQTSPIGFNLTETTNGNTRTATVQVVGFGAVPSGNYKIFAAVAEKVVNQTTSNGESVHRDVFRDMLTSTSGDNFTMPGAGQTTTLTFQYSLTGLNPDEAYLTVFIRDMDNNSILNSGTRFDPLVSNTTEPVVQSLRIFPNPVVDEARIDLSDDLAVATTVYGLDGKIVWTSSNEQGVASVLIPTADLPKGVYLVKIQGENGQYSGKFVK